MEVLGMHNESLNMASSSSSSSPAHVVGVDSSPESENMFRWACESLPQKDRLIVFHAKNTTPFFDGDEEWFPALDRNIQVANKEHSKIKEKYSKMCFDCKRECEFKSGEYDSIKELAHKICSLAEKERADSVICASKGKGRLSAALLGSASTSVLHECKCPVTILRPPSNNQENN